MKASCTGVTPTKRYEFATRSLDELRELLAVGPHPRHVQPMGSSFDFSLSTTECAGLVAARLTCASGLDFVRVSPRDGYFLVLPSSGFVRVEANKTLIDADPRHGAMIDELASSRSRYGSALQMEYVHVDTGTLEAQLADTAGMAPRKRIEFKPGIDSRDSAAVALLHLTRALLDGARGTAPLMKAPLALQNLCSAIVQIMLTGLPHNYSDAIENGKHGKLLPRQVRRAIEFMRAHAAQPITMSQIAAAAATSPRTLQDGFRKFCDVTPMEFMREIRLQGVRVDLLDPAKPQLISEIARRWGFFHLGIFAARYSKRFGERPGDTLRRREPS